MPSTVAEALRLSRGLTQTELAVRAGVSQTAVSLLETGAMGPSRSVVEAVAAALNAPAPLFTLPAPDVHLLHAMKDSVSAAAVKRVTSEFVLAFIRTEILAPGIRHAIRQSGEPPTERAEQLRRTWQMAPGRVGNIINVLESNGVTCARRELTGTKVNALAATVGNHRAMMFVDPRASTEDVTWAIAHELAHLALHKAPDRRHEDAADEFAGEFLAPQSEVRQRLTAGEESFDLPNTFLMPPARFAVHARRSRLITVADYRRLRMQSSPPWTRADPGEPSRVADVVTQRTKQGETVEQVAAAAFLTTNELRRDYM